MRRGYLQDTQSTVHLQAPDLDELPNPPGPAFLAYIPPKGKNPVVEFDAEKGLQGDGHEKLKEHRGSIIRSPRIRFGGLPMGIFKSSPHSSNSNEQWKQEEAAHAASVRLSRDREAMYQKEIHKEPDRWKPLPPVPASRHSGLPLHLFASRPQSLASDTQPARDERVQETQVKRKPVPTPKKAKKRGSGLPLNMFGSNNDTQSSSSTWDGSKLGSSF
jgi:hypothetical protein